MNTPLMELIEWMKFETLPLPIPDTLILAKATELLEKERDAVTLAYFDGVTAGINQDKQEVISPSKYFEQNYS